MRISCTREALEEDRSSYTSLPIQCKTSLARTCRNGCSDARSLFGSGMVGTCGCAIVCHRIWLCHDSKLSTCNVSCPSVQLIDTDLLMCRFTYLLQAHLEEYTFCVHPLRESGLTQAPRLTFSGALPCLRHILDNSFGTLMETSVKRYLPHHTHQHPEIDLYRICTGLTTRMLPLFWHSIHILPYITHGCSTHGCSLV